MATVVVVAALACAVAGTTPRPPSRGCGEVRLLAARMLGGSDCPRACPRCAAAGFCWLCEAWRARPSRGVWFVCVVSEGASLVQSVWVVVRVSERAPASGGLDAVPLVGRAQDELNSLV